MHLDQAGYKLIVGLECKIYKCYKDGRGFPTIGIGHLVLPTEPELLTKQLTEQDVSNLFKKDLAIREKWLNQRCCNWEPKMQQYEFNALCSFLWQYNIDRYPDTKAVFILGHRPTIISQMKQFRNEVAGSGDNKMVARRGKEIDMFKGLVK